MSRIDAKTKLEEAIQEYVREVSSVDHLVRTDYTLTVAAVDYHAPANATFYYHEHSGPMHSRAGLIFMAQDDVKLLNREEALAED